MIGKDSAVCFFLSSETIKDYERLKAREVTWPFLTRLPLHQPTILSGWGACGRPEDLFATFCFFDDDDDDDDGDDDDDDNDDDDDRFLQSLVLVRLLVTNFITRAPLFIFHKPTLLLLGVT